MFPEGTLLDRIRRAGLGVPPPRTMTIDVAKLNRSIQENLRRILNTRHGSSAAQKDLGMMAPSDVALQFPQNQMLIEQAIKKCIEKYEPRLERVEVTYLEILAGPGKQEVLTLQFQISGRLRGTNQNLEMNFDTTIDSGGQIRLLS